MFKCYQYTAEGYYAGEADDYGILPNNATRTAPTLKEGFIPCWDGKKWGQIEDHKGKSGYVNGQPCEIKEYGPLPEGWSDTPPIPTTNELFDRLRGVRDARLDATDKYLLADSPINPEALEAVKAYRQALRGLPAQSGAPWDGGGELTPWPDMPEV